MRPLNLSSKFTFVIIGNKEQKTIWQLPFHADFNSHKALLIYVK